jgi:ribosomal protein S18 acetylase RimI-like enzyme
VRIRAAEPDDVEAIAAIVERAYGVYVERIGLRPGPMDDDYGEQVRRGLVHVAEEGGEVVGLIVLVEGEGRLTIENVAVDPGRQGEGIGRRLLEFAEQAARGAGIETVALYTHELMSENLALYTRLGYEEDERRGVTAFGRTFSRVFMSKRL